MQRKSRRRSAALRAANNIHAMIFSRANLGTFFTSLAIQSCGMVTGILTARVLGPAARGELATVLLWPVILSNLGLMGCNWALARAVASDPASESNLTASAVVVGLLAALGFCALGYFLLPVVLPPDRAHLVPLARLCLLVIPCDIFNQMLLAVEHGRMRWRRFNLVRGSFYLFYLSLIVLVWAVHKSQVRWFVWAFLAGQFLSVLLRSWAQRSSFAQGRPSLVNGRKLLREGMPYWGATAGNLLTLQIDTILVVSWMSAEAAGLYVVASAFGNALFSMGDALGATSFAVISAEKTAQCREKLLTETFRQAVLIAIGLAALAACAVPVFVRVLFGRNFSPAIAPATGLVLTAALTVSATILNQGLRGAGRPHAGLLSQLLGSGVLVFTAWFFLKPYGLMGMVLAVAAGASTQILVLVVTAARWLQIPPRAFWPFDMSNARGLVRQALPIRWRWMRSPA